MVRLSHTKEKLNVLGQAKNPTYLCQDRKAICGQNTNRNLWIGQFRISKMYRHYFLLSFFWRKQHEHGLYWWWWPPHWENSRLLLCFCNGWDASPGDQGRRPVLSASATLRHYKLAARKPHCSARSRLPGSSAGLSGITPPATASFAQTGDHGCSTADHGYLWVLPSGLCPQKSHFLSKLLATEIGSGV